MRMGRMVLSLGLAGFVAVFLGGVAQAACVQSDIAGTWYIHLTNEDEDGAWRLWAYCTVKVKSTGAVVAGTACKTSQGDTQTINGGKFTVGSDCVWNGNLKIGNGAVIDHGIVNRGKDFVSAVGHDQNGGLIKLDGVKK
ncbi:MAG TPA: hypothetical protein PLM79_17175 [Syntrophobacteraceae bacterium]|nr:hypothetical protein [Syntrophobacteraceae bacterium]